MTVASTLLKSHGRCEDIVPTTVDCEQLSLPALSFFFAGRADSRREWLEQFVARVYERIYGAQVSHFHEVLVGCLGLDGQLQAVLGLTPLEFSPAFLEQYLEWPVEHSIDVGGQRARRERVVELGNLAAQVPGASRSIIRYMTRYLHTRGYRHVVFTATQALSNSFARLHYEPRVIAKADPSRLRTGPNSWGSYYDSNPQVMVGDVRAAYAALF
jgi:hypothetical protein